MADLVITPANVVPGANSVKEFGIAGATIAAGQVVYKDPTTLKWLLADVDSATAAVRDARGIALNGASNNQPLAVHLSGDITIGATLTLGVAYFASDTPGGIMPAADAVESGDYPVFIGLPKSTTVLNVQFVAAGAVI